MSDEGSFDEELDARVNLDGTDVLVSKTFLKLAHQLNDFYKSNHTYNKEYLRAPSLRCRFQFICERTERPKHSEMSVPPSPDYRTPSEDPIFPWPADCSLDKSEFRRALKSFSERSDFLVGFLATEEKDKQPEQPNMSGNPDNRGTSVETEEVDRNAGVVSSHRNTNATQNNNTGPAGFSPEQWAAMTNFLRILQGVNEAAAAGQNGPYGRDNEPYVREWRAEDVGYIDTEAEDEADGPIVTIGRHTFYRDVYAFTDRLRDISCQRGEEKVRTVIPECLRGACQRGYSIELSQLEKDLLRDASLERWIGVLVRRFKLRTAQALDHLVKEKYSAYDARKGKHPRDYVQNMVRYSRAAGFKTPHTQILAAWNGLDDEFKITIDEPTEETSIRRFMDQIEAKSDIWMSLVRRNRLTLSKPFKNGYDQGQY